jgi:hypothetical protein
MFLVLEILRTSLLLATHSKTDYNSLFRVAEISLAVVADAQKVESSTYSAHLGKIQTPSLFPHFVTLQTYSKIFFLLNSQQSTHNTP